jgi:hypothetical protein
MVSTHLTEIDPDVVWLRVLESIGDCMKEGGPMAKQSIGVTGNEEHRRIVREVLGAQGVASERVVARLAPGSAECQGGVDCDRVVAITLEGQ